MTQDEILSLMKDLCAEAGYIPTVNIIKIARAKERLFKDGDPLRCPCDGLNPNRYCISEQCKKDIEENGECHCHCYSRG